MSVKALAIYLATGLKNLAGIRSGPVDVSDLRSFGSRKTKWNVTGLKVKVSFPVRDSLGCSASITSIRSSLVSDVSIPVVLVAVLAKCSLRASKTFCMIVIFWSYFAVSCIKFLSCRMSIKPEILEIFMVYAFLFTR